MAVISEIGHFPGFSDLRKSDLSVSQRDPFGKSRVQVRLLLALLLLFLLSSFSITEHRPPIIHFVIR